MKKIILLIPLVIIIVTCKSYCLNVEDYNFFGFKITNTLKEVKYFLNSEKKKYKIYNEYDEYEDTWYSIIEPINQNIIELENLDFSVVFYNKNIFKITKFLIDNDYFNKIKKDFGKYSRIENHGSYIFYIWDFKNNYEIIIKEDVSEKIFFSIEILNNKY